MQTTGPDETEFRKLSDFRSRIPGHRRDSRCHLSTLIRWATKGVRTATGEVVRLQAVRLGAKWLCTDEWFREFTRKLTLAAAPSASTPPAPARSPARRARDAVKVDAKLDAILA